MLIIIFWWRTLWLLYVTWALGPLASWSLLGIRRTLFQDYMSPWKSTLEDHLSCNPMVFWECGSIFCGQIEWLCSFDPIGMNFFVELVISFTFAGLVQKSRVLGFDIYGHICQAGALLEILLTLVPSILYILQQSNSYNSPTLNWLLDSLFVVKNEMCFKSRTIFQLPFMCSCCMWNLFQQNCVKMVSICVFLVCSFDE